MMNWLAIPRPELCFREADSFAAIWFGVFSLLNKSDPRTTLNRAGKTLAKWVNLFREEGCSAFVTDTRTRSDLISTAALARCCK